jgi:hypothetical protein
VTVQTLCAVPAGLTAVAADTTVTTANGPVTIRRIKAQWTAVPGATAYRVWYRPLTMNSNWLFQDVTGATQKLIQPVYPGVPYAVRVQALNCPASGSLGDFSATAYVNTVNPQPACGPAPSVTAVSPCPNQITVQITGGTGAPWRVTLRRLAPSYTAGVSYTTSSTLASFAVGTQFAGSVWEVFAQSICSPSNPVLYSPTSNVAMVTVKASCDAPQNLVLSHPTCNGFTAAWNPAQCSGIPVVNYQVYLKKTTAANYTSYNAGLSDHKTFPWPALQAGATYEVFVRAIACNGAVGLPSQVQTIIPGGVGCRGEEADTEALPQGVTHNGTSVLVYPNPATEGYFEVDVARSQDEQAELKIELIDALGRVLYTDFSQAGAHANQRLTLPRGVASGAYLVRVTVGTETFAQRLVVQND